MDPKKERYRRIRGLMLKLLAHQHPAPLEAKELHFLLDDLRYTLSEEEIRSHLCYLAERGLVKTETRTAGRIEIEMIKITADGLNVLDKFTTDVGVNVEF